MLNQVKNNVRSLFLSSAMLIGGAFGLSGCSEGDDPKPAGPTELTGRISGFTFQTIGENFVSAGFSAYDKENNYHIIGLNPDASKTNATVTFTETDPITEKSEIRAEYDNTIVTATKNKPLVAIIRFDDNAKFEDTKGFKEIRVNADDLSELVIQPWDTREVPQLLDRTRFKSIFNTNMKQLGDADPNTPGNQPVRMSVWFFQ